MHSSSSTLGLLLVALGVLVLGCEQAAGAAQPTAEPATASTAVTASAKVVPIARVVFVDLEDACACTRERIDLSWAALTQALGTPARLPVERIHQDSQAAQADPYLKARPLMVPPGVYFVDAKGEVLEQLQGEVTADQVAAVLSAH
jgi:hypothetical protein